MLRFFLPFLILFFLSCKSLGIKLSELKPVDSSNKCNTESEVRSYRVLFLLPFYQQKLSEPNFGTKSKIVNIREYAKPWDIAFTFIGFLFSLNSSTKIYTFCDSTDMETMEGNSSMLPFSHYKAVNSSKPAEMLSFPKDDYHVDEKERVKLVQLAHTLLKAEEKFQLILVGKTNSSGDIAYQTRLTKRRAEEIKSVFVGESFDADRITLVLTEKEFGGTESVSNIAIFLIKE